MLCVQVTGLKIWMWKEDDEIPVWNGSRADNGAEDSPQFGPHLTKAQRDEMDALLCELSAVMSNTPRKTHLMEHRIETWVSKVCKVTSIPNPPCLYGKS